MDTTPAPTEQRAALGWLRRHLHPGQRLLVVERYVPRSGQHGVYALYHPALAADADPTSLDWAVAQVTRVRRSARHNGLLVRQGGSTSGRVRYLLTQLSCALWPMGYACLGRDACPAAQHQLDRAGAGGGVHPPDEALRYRIL